MANRSVKAEYPAYTQPGKTEPVEIPQVRDFSGLVQSRDQNFNWVFAGVLLCFHLAAIAAFFAFSWSALLVFAGMWICTENLGIAMGYHRLLTHRGYVTPPWLEHLIAICGTMALQGGPIYWVAVHRLHHQLTDRPGDPHSPRDGKWWSHVGWILRGHLHNETRLLEKYAPDLARDPFYVWLSRYHWLPVTVVGIALYFGGGWPWVLWGVFLRATLGLHVTWLVNSATHIWGSRRFATRDDSRNNWWVALLSGGEGWHNNHHAHPVSSRHGLAWYELDLNYACIRMLAAVGLAHKVTIARVDGTSQTGS